MSHIEKHLAAGERVLFTTTRVFSRTTVVVFGVLAIALCLLGPVGAVAGMFIAAVVLSAWMKARACEFAVTSKRVVIKVGILSVRTIEMNLDKIESVEVMQPWLRAHRSCGNVQLIGSGASRETFTNIMSALEFRRAVQEARDQNRLSA